MGIVLYGSAKKGIKFALALVPVAYGLFYVVITFAPHLLLGI